MELFSPRHLLVILLIVLVVFGTKKLKTIGQDLGGAVKGFKNAMSEGEKEAETQPEDKPAADAARLTQTAESTAAPAKSDSTTTKQG
ncbi:MAG: hypothetical protein RLZZ200_1479 [Pseudomonadota bacterium]|jgi:sec-independent protein translocase protein TatA